MEPRNMLVGVGHGCLVKILALCGVYVEGRRYD